MSILIADQKDCFCAFCKSSQKVYTKKRVGLKNILASLLAAGISMMAIFQQWDPRFFILFVVFLAVAEIFIQIRWRLAMVCKHCGFDPVLYLKNTSLAVQKVQKRLEERKGEVGTLLAPRLKMAHKINPRAKSLSIREEAMIKAKEKKGSLISKEV